MHQITKRFISGVDLKQSILQTSRKHKIPAGVVVCSVGSLEQAKLRMPGAQHDHSVEKQFDGPLEIISLNGRISESGSHLHMHLAVSDEEGNVYGGHLLEGCIVRTTLELVILVFEDIRYKSILDEKTGFLELEVQKL